MWLDQQLFLFVQGFTGNPFLDTLMLFFAETMVLLVPASLIYLWFSSEEERRDSIFTFLATITGISFTYVMGLFYFHHQPFATYDTIVSGGDLNNAFASQHTATVFSCFWSYLYLQRRRLTEILGVAGILTGVGRVFVGHHYPMDILGGIVSGLLGLFVIARLDGEFPRYIDQAVKVSYRIEDRLRSVLDR